MQSRHKRWLKGTVLVALPVVLYLLIVEQFSWRPRIIATSGVSVNALAFSPDGKLLASGSGDGTLSLWSVETLALLKMIAKGSGPIRDVTFSADGKILAWGSDDYGVQVYDTSTGKLRWKSEALEGIDAITFSPDGKYLACAAGKYYPRVYLWDEQGRPLGMLRVVQGCSGALAFSPDGNTLLIGTKINTMEVWDVRSRKLNRIVIGPVGKMSPIAFSHDHKTVASLGQSYGLWLWDASAISSGNAQRKPAVRLAGGHDDDVAEVAFSPDGNTLASGSHDRSVKLWNTSTGQAERIIRGDNRQIFSIVISPDGNTLASGAINGTIKLWRIK